MHVKLVMSFNVRGGSAAIATARCGCRLKVPSRVLLRVDAVFDFFFFVNISTQEDEDIRTSNLHFIRHGSNRLSYLLEMLYLMYII
jgi:hypothetical protein